MLSLAYPMIQVELAAQHEAMQEVIGTILNPVSKLDVPSSPAFTHSWVKRALLAMAFIFGLVKVSRFATDVKDEYAIEIRVLGFSRWAFVVTPELSHLILSIAAYIKMSVFRGSCDFLFIHKGYEFYVPAEIVNKVMHLLIEVVEKYPERTAVLREALRKAGEQMLAAQEGLPVEEQKKVIH